METECYFTADIAFPSPLCLAYCVAVFKDVHKYYFKLMTGGLWLSDVSRGYVNVSQLGQPDLNPGSCSRNNIKWIFKKYAKIWHPKPHCSLVLWHFWAIVLYYPIFKMALYSSSTLCVGGGFPFFYTF